jgi:nucleoside-diphosphate-sugar epimerase
MAVVVTGSAGFLGRIVTRTLLRAGYAVTGIDRVPASGAGPKDHLEITADLLDGDPRVEEALAGAEAVLHLAGCPGVRDQRADITRRRYRDNVLSAAAVFEAVPLDVHLVVVTSSSVYGGCRGGRPSAEDDPLRPAGGYAKSKARAEMLCAARIAAGGRVAVARPFTVAGEGQRADMALATWLTDAAAGRPLRIIGSPERTRDITDVRDVARVLTAIVERGVTGPVNVGTGVGHSIGDLVDAVGAALDVEVRTCVVPARPEEAADTLADTRRLRRAVGFVPVTDLADVLRRQVAAASTSASVVAG